jgi:DNA end-binding protein Ku
MARALWKGSISFGLVNVPVLLHTAEARANEIEFTLLDKDGLQPVHYERVDGEGRVVPFADIVKGYRHADGRYIVLTDEDFARANVEATQTVDILDLVRADEIAPYFYDTPYYLVPQKSGIKGYALLREVLAKSGYVAVSKVVIRTRQHIAALIPRGRLLVLDVLRYAYELREPEDLELPGSDLAELGITDREVAAAESLVEAMVEPWDAARYHDTYHDDLLKMIEEKAATGVTRPAPPRPAAAQSNVVDIMGLLKQSVDDAKKRRAAGEVGRARTRRPVARKAADE